MSILFALMVAGCAPDVAPTGRSPGEVQRDIDIAVPNLSHYPGDPRLDQEPSPSPILNPRQAGGLVCDGFAWNGASRADIEAAGPMLTNFVHGFVFIEVETIRVRGADRHVARYRHQASGLGFIVVPGFAPLVQDDAGGYYRDATVAPLLMAEREVTVEAWARIGRSRGGEESSGDVVDDGGAAAMSWEHAAAFCLALGLQLPTEVEIEHATFGGLAAGGAVSSGDFNAFGLKGLMPGRWEWTLSWPRPKADGSWRAVAISRSGERSGKSGFERIDRLLAGGDSLEAGPRVHLRPVARFDRSIRGR